MYARTSAGPQLHRQLLEDLRGDPLPLPLGVNDQDADPGSAVGRILLHPVEDADRLAVFLQVDRVHVAAGHRSRDGEVALKHVEVEATRLAFRSRRQREVRRIACEDIEHSLDLVVSEFADDQPLGLELVSDGMFVIRRTRSAPHTG
jgi:hypothetical protein